MSIVRIREFLSYNPETGEFRWIKSSRANVHPGDLAGAINGHGYRYIQFRGHAYRAHRLAWWFVHGAWPPGDLDHKDLDRDNNAIGNLRPATDVQNNANSSLQRNNTSGFKGVSFDKQSGRWKAYIGGDGGQKNLGRFASLEEAANAYDAAARVRFGVFARLNFSEGANGQAN
jgi:hypothetical protein